MATINNIYDIEESIGNGMTYDKENVYETGIFVAEDDMGFGFDDNAQYVDVIADKNELFGEAW